MYMYIDIDIDIDLTTVSHEFHFHTLMSGELKIAHEKYFPSELIDATSVSVS